MSNKILKRIHKELLNNRKTVSVAESCTGGLLSNFLTGLPGSSNYFLLGIVAYSNKAKEKILGIPKKTIIKCGAVSAQTAMLMAKNIRKKINSDFGLSITGIASPVASPQSKIKRCNGAGPTGAIVNKPTGTVFICLSGKNKNICQRFCFRGSRSQIRKKSAYQALRLLCAHLSQ